MGQLSERVATHTLIGLDTSVFIYHLEGHPDYQPLTQELLAGVETGQLYKPIIRRAIAPLNS